MGHGPSTKWKKDESQRFKTKLGLIMFAIYVPVYFAFPILAVVNTKLMGMDIGGLNFAVVYGIGIILLAVVQALIYNFICSRREKADKAGQGKGGN